MHQAVQVAGLGAASAGGAELFAAVQAMYKGIVIAGLGAAATFRTGHHSEWTPFTFIIQEHMFCCQAKSVKITREYPRGVGNEKRINALFGAAAVIGRKNTPTG